MTPPNTFETPRLLLRPPAMEDAGSIFQEYAQDADVTRYLSWRPHADIDVTRAFLRECLSVRQRGVDYRWAIVRKEDGRLMGMVGFRTDDHGVMFGYVLARAYWGNGYMAEALQPLIDWALKQEGVHRVWAFCDVENNASARVLEKVGMQREGLLRRWSLHPNRSKEPRDCYCYSKIR